MWHRQNQTLKSTACSEKSESNKQNGMGHNLNVSEDDYLITFYSKADCINKKPHCRKLKMRNPQTN